MGENLYLSDEQAAAIQAAAAQEQQKQAEHESAIKRIVQVGQEQFGTEKFDEARRAFDGISGETAAVLLGSDTAPQDIIELANNPAELEKFLKLPPRRQQQFLDRRAATRSPYGHVATNAQPAWMARQPQGRLADKDWNSGIQDLMPIDEWSKEFDRRQRLRFEERKWKGR
jgi:hypothetical protein